jgi:hypothetical protein
MKKSNKPKPALPKFVIVYGPPMSGKTINKEAMREHYKCDSVFDVGFEDASILAAGGRVMVLATDENPRGPAGQRNLYKKHTVKISVGAAALALGDRWIPAATA